MKIAIKLGLAALGFTLMASPALADDVNLTLISSSQVGTVIDFTATVSAPLSNGAAVFLNSDSTTIDFPLVLDDSDFFNNFPPSLNPGQSVTDVLFAVDVPTYAPLYVPYNGYFEIDGGADSGASNYLASVSFMVTPTPEPGSVVLLLTGLSGFATALRRKRCPR